MSLTHTPLDPSALSPAVARIVGANVPAPAKMMAARGLAPMGPQDLVVTLYQLALDSDLAVAAAAKETATKLPEGVLAAALGSPLDERVLDFFANVSLRRAKLIEAILLNSATSDQTFVYLATQLGEQQLEILATNQMRMLRCPAIIEALYFNRAARMSTVDRLLELAVRNGLVLNAIPQFKAIAANVLGAAKTEAPTAEVAQALSAKHDAIFATFLGEQEDHDTVGALEFDASATDGTKPAEEDSADGKDKDEDEEHATNIATLPVNAKIRKATLGTVFERMVLIRDSNRSVSMAAISSPSVNENEAAKHAANRSLSEDIIRFIADKRDWQRNYGIKLALINNPKCPLSHSMRLLMHLRPNDLRAVSRSKSVPGTLAAAAKQALARRS